MRQQPYLPPPILPPFKKKNKASMLHLGVHKLIPLHLEHRWESWERKRCRLSRKYRRCTKFRLAVWLVPSHIVAGWHTTKTANEGGSDLLHRSLGDWNASYLGNLESLQCFYARGKGPGIWIFIFSHSVEMFFFISLAQSFQTQPVENRSWKLNRVFETDLQFWSPICQPAS